AVRSALAGALAAHGPARLAGARVAVALGSRGLGRYPDLVAGALDALAEIGATPTLMPAMGSHGGGTPEGQAQVLRGYGLVPDGVPLDPDDAVERVGESPLGTPLFASRVARAADVVVLLNRVKSHTGFRGEVESGLTKMLVVGLGKRPGAAALHALGYDGFADRLAAAREALLAHYPPLVGVGVVEDAEGRPAHVEAIPGPALGAREPALLRDAKARMATLPFAALDVLVVERAGKDVSGLGMDPNVTGRFQSGPPGPPAPTRVALLSLTPDSEGNAAGMGHADVVPAAFAHAIDPVPTWTNALTSTSLPSARMPLVVPDAADAVRVALATCGAAPDAARIAWIRDTSDLRTYRASRAALDAVQDHPAAPTELGPAEPPPLPR
ncbi:MAG: hypothetical protein RI554_08995, partial [Trueperaceae bacterium]|nr:hypothetical protein [Trueperaceae bacterium]